jgi:hypothetical protein
MSCTVPRMVPKVDCACAFHVVAASSATNNRARRAHRPAEKYLAVKTRVRAFACSSEFSNGHAAQELMEEELRDAFAEVTNRHTPHLELAKQLL